MNKFFLTIIFFFYSYIVWSQDDFFTSYRNAGLIINSAETGRIERMNKLVVASRTQWLTISRKAFHSYYAGLESQVLCLGQNFVGLGILIITEKAGLSGFQRSIAMPSLAYHQSLSDEVYLSLGFQIGALQYKLGNKQLSFNSQFNGFEYDANLDNRENFHVLNLIKLDAKAGILLYNKTGKWSFGFEFDHLLTPNMTFLQTGDNELGIGIKLHGNYSLSDFIGIQALFKDYGLIDNKQWHSFLGIYGKIFENIRTDFSFRATNRVGIDAIILGFVLHSDIWELGINYDAGISSLSRGTYGFNGVELFGSILFGNKKACVNCPKF